MATATATTPSAPSVEPLPTTKTTTKTTQPGFRRLVVFTSLSDARRAA
jgi:hypothetical protein